jgi:hypothetical protein
VLAGLIVGVFLTVLDGSRDEPPGSLPAQTVVPVPESTVVPEPSPAPSPNRGFEQFDQELQGLVTRDATWHAPDALTVNETARIGLVIGQLAPVRDRLRQLVPSDAPRSAGQVVVGPTVRVVLEANRDDADVVPSVSLDESSGSNTALLFSWQVHPKKPMDSLLLTAHIEVPLSNGQVLASDVPLTLPVHGTPWYYVSDFLRTYAAAIAALVTASLALAGFQWRRRRRHRDLRDVGVL